MPGKVHRLHCEVSICIVPAVGIEGADRCGGSQEVDVGTLLRSMWTSMDSHEPFNSTSHTGGGGGGIGFFQSHCTPPVTAVQN